MLLSQPPWPRISPLIFPVAVERFKVFFASMRSFFSHADVPSQQNNRTSKHDIHIHTSYRGHTSLSSTPCFPITEHTETIRHSAVSLRLPLSLRPAPVRRYPKLSYWRSVPFLRKDRRHPTTFRALTPSLVIKGRVLYLLALARLVLTRKLASQTLLSRLRLMVMRAPAHIMRLIVCDTYVKINMQKDR